RTKSYDVGSHAANVLVVEAPFGDDAAAVVLGDHVCRGAEMERELAAAWRAQVEAHALLPAAFDVERPAAVRLVALERHEPQEVEVRARLDLDHFRTELAQEAAELGHDRADAEVHGADAGERRGHGRAARDSRPARRRFGNA